MSLSARNSMYKGDATSTPGEEEVKNGEAISEVNENLRPKGSSGWKTWLAAFKRNFTVLELGCLALLILFNPLAWVSHNLDWSHKLTFSLSFIAMIPLEILFDWCTERLTKTLETSGKVGGFVGDLITITFDNAIEAALAIWLLIKCELRILQSTVIGVIVLHLLFVQGASFLFGGIQLQGQGQALRTHQTDMNRSLLTIGMYTILLPTTYYIALSHEIPGTGSTSNVLSDDTRHQLLVISRGYSVILIIVYVLTRVYLYFSAVDGREGNISEILRKYRVTIHKARRTLRVETTTLDATSSSENVDRSEQSREQHPEHVIQRTSSMPKEHIQCNTAPWDITVPWDRGYYGLTTLSKFAK